MKILYKDRNIEELGKYYLDHVSAMTSEGLHSKSDIAAELAYRDKRYNELALTLKKIIKYVDNLEREIADLEEELDLDMKRFRVV